MHLERQIPLSTQTKRRFEKRTGFKLEPSEKVSYCHRIWHLSLCAQATLTYRWINCVTFTPGPSTRAVTMFLGSLNLVTTNLFSSCVTQYSRANSRPMKPLYPNRPTKDDLWWPPEEGWKARKITTERKKQDVPINPTFTYQQWSQEPQPPHGAP